MSEETLPLVCPKCGSDMRSYERNGVVVDQCTDCRGLFLDRGELEKLVDAEGSHYERESSRRESDSHGKPEKKSRKRSFLEGLLEGGE